MEPALRSITVQDPYQWYLLAMDTNKCTAVFNFIKNIQWINDTELPVMEIFLDPVTGYISPFIPNSMAWPERWALSSWYQQLEYFGRFYFFCVFSQNSRSSSKFFPARGVLGHLSRRETHKKKNCRWDALWSWCVLQWDHTITLHF